MLLLTTPVVEIDTGEVARGSCMQMPRQIYLKPNKITAASTSLLLGTEQAGGEPPWGSTRGASEQRLRKRHREL